MRRSSVGWAIPEYRRGPLRVVKSSGLRVKAEEVEEAVVEYIGEMARTEGLLEQVVAETNARLLSQAPVLEKQQRALQRQLTRVNGEAGKVLAQWFSGEGKAIVTERLNGLAQRREEIERGLLELAQVQEGRVSAEVVREALTRVHEVWEQLKPYGRQEFMRLVVNRAEVGLSEMVLEINGGALPVMAQTPQTTSPGTMVRQIQGWLPEQDER